MTPKQFDALVKMIRVIARAEMTPTFNNVAIQDEDIAETRALLVVEPAKEIQQQCKHGMTRMFMTGKVECVDCGIELEPSKP